MRTELLPVLLLLLLPPPGPAGSCRGAEGQSLPPARPAAKKGECPPPGSRPPTACGEFCSTDEDCPGGERCCGSGCGRECRLPRGVKQGLCPRLESDMMSICLVECSSDSECKGREKCCAVGCHVHCVLPVPAHPGVCPKKKVLQTFAPCKSTCSDDIDCPHHQKCCFTGCGRGCLTPERGTVALLLPADWGYSLGPAASNSTVSSGDMVTSCLCLVHAADAAVTTPESHCRDLPALWVFVLGDFYQLAAPSQELVLSLLRTRP
ncbi:WAP four-disulfide core domain protein 8-like [Phaenicophaeus curvirostris]|uniref:WAP four-disulfide core domain protein 8-like n=1 Tax=Phaenicophaeus curvirostris TaxID=33595 RepID=UPI0037F0E747